MAGSTIAARRYAEALFSAARTSGEIDAVERDLEALDELLRTTPRLLEVLRNPLLPVARKRDIVDRLLGDTVTAITLRFLYLVIEKRRSEVLPEVHELYQALANEHRGIVPAFVSSALPLTSAEEQALSARLMALTGMRIELHTSVDPGLIGGLQVRVGDTVLDGTVVGYLRQLRQRLRASLV